MTKQTGFIKSAKRTIALERDAVNSLLDAVDENFNQACNIILQNGGRVVVTGIGKSGHIANKIAATLASTGTPAMFVHPAEASHGDMGMIIENDVVLALSNSGNTPEVVTLLPLIKRLGVKLISFTQNPLSILASASDAHVKVKVDTEACPLDLAPTSSTTAALVMGDALAIALLEARGFTAEDFAFSHPGGTLGKKLLLKVKDIMRTGKNMPMVKQNALLTDALLEMTQKGMGMTGIQQDNGRIAGIFTDGDLRRALDKKLDVRTTPINQVMTANCRTVKADVLAAEVLAIMDDKKINAIIVVDTDNKPIGALNMHDLLNAGVV